MAEGARAEISDTLSRSLKDLPNEEWKDIPGYAGRYEVSNYSRIKSNVKKIPIILKKVFENGRFKVVLVSKRGVQKKEFCGRLTAIAFIREPEENEVLLYENNNRLLDISDNLKWISKKESIASARSNGSYSNTFNKGINNGMAVLTKDEVLKIREMRRSGKTCREIKDAFNVSIRSIEKVVYKETWKNI
ncbi:NUMOD4 domain-containing protein [Chryseobacterium sp. JK1]|uniref:NUMOD4 domain-containing protein n=1 Tax=Chryseobacterium sp. JK1 TaxID=874294 RepID=UPI003D695077